MASTTAIQQIEDALERAGFQLMLQDSPPQGASARRITFETYSNGNAVILARRVTMNGRDSHIELFGALSTTNQVADDIHAIEQLAKGGHVGVIDHTGAEA